MWLHILILLLSDVIWPQRTVSTLLMVMCCYSRCKYNTWTNVNFRVISKEILPGTKEFTGLNKSSRPNVENMLSNSSTATNGLPPSRVDTSEGTVLNTFGSFADITDIGKTALVEYIVWNMQMTRDVLYLFVDRNQSIVLRWLKVSSPTLHRHVNDAILINMVK